MKTKLLITVCTTLSALMVYATGAPVRYPFGMFVILTVLWVIWIVEANTKP